MRLISISMLNIFNNFLFLLAFWAIFMLLSNNFKFMYLYLGVVSSFAVALISFFIKIYDKKSQFLYLSIGFYRHFLNIYFENFLSSIFLLFKMALFPQKLISGFYNLKLLNDKFSENDVNLLKKIELDLLIASINLHCAILALDHNCNKIKIHYLNKNYYKKINLNKIKRSLTTINDCDLV